MTIKHVGEFPDEEIFAIYTEAPGGGDVDNIGAMRNRPALDPEAWFSSVFFHSNLDNMEVAVDQTTSVTHPATDAGSGSTGTTAAQAIPYDYDTAVTDHVLVTHSLGVLPFALVVIGNAAVTPGYIVQIASNGATRYVCPIVTTSQVILREFRSRGAAGLSSIGIDYRALVFRPPPAPSGNKLRDFDPVTGIVKLARNRFDSSKKYLQVVSGGTPFGLAIGRTMQARNGAPRTVNADGSTYSPIPSTLNMYIRASSGTFASDTSPPPGLPMNYTGSFTTDNYIDVQVP